MYKKLILLLVVVLATITITKAQKCYCKTHNSSPLVISKNIKYCEGSVVYKGRLLLSNFGTTELNPLNNEGKGYIMILDGDNTEIFISGNGNLNAPKGMAVSKNYLYIADVGKVVVYNLKEKYKTPQIIEMPKGNLFVNDIVVYGEKAYISVTDTDKIYSLDISNPKHLSSEDLSVFANVKGANGLVIDGKTMYIASYPANGKTTSENVIYKIKSISSPKVEKLFDRAGQYDGLAIKGNRLYFTNWVNGEVGYVNLINNKVELLNMNGVKITGPADISILNGKLYIPNLPSSETIVVTL